MVQMGLNFIVAKVGNFLRLFAKKYRCKYQLALFKADLDILYQWPIFATDPISSL